MALTKLIHVNLRTARLETMRRFYCDVLGLHEGPRPPFPFNGAWLYLGDQPFVHLIEISKTLTTREPSLEHFAFDGEDMADFVAHLKQQGVNYEISIVPGFNIHQVNIFDPDDNHIHIDFSADDAAQLTT